MSEEIFLPPNQILALTFVPETTTSVIKAGLGWRRDALVKQASALTEVVAENQPDAAALLGEVQKFLNEIEAARTEVKAPFLKVNKRIDISAKDFTGTLDQAKEHLKRILGIYAQAQERLANEAQATQDKQLAHLRTQREAAVIAGDEAAVLACDLSAAEALSGPLAPVNPNALTTVRHKWVVGVYDIAKLYAVFPELVKLEPKLREINAAVTRMAAESSEPPMLPGCNITRELDVTAR